MIDSKLIYAIIPARGGSKRLPRKNITPVWGKPMLYWAIRACQNSQYIDECYVSTEDDEIATLSKKFGAKSILRPKELANDFVFKQDVIVHAVEALEKKPGIVVSLQPNSPEICAKDLDAAIEKLTRNDRNEIFSVNEELFQNAAFRIMKYETVFQKTLSTYCGVFVTSYIDVHTIADIDFLEKGKRPCESDRG